MKKFHNLSRFITVCLIFFLSSSPIWGADAIRIGVIGPMKFLQGQGHWNGALMAADEINAGGGLQVGDRKLPIRLFKADSNEFLNITDAVSAMEMLLGQYRVDFVVGGFRSEAVLAMQDIAMDYRTIFIGCGASLGKLSERVAEDYDRYKYFFRGAPLSGKFLAKTSFLQAKFVAEIIKEKLGIPKVKVAIVAENAAWVTGLVGAAQKVLPKMGMEVVGVWKPSPIATDVTPELKAIQQSGAHMIFTVFSSVVGIPFAKQANELKIPALQVGINVEAQKGGFHEATKGNSDGIMTLTTYCEGIEINHLTNHFVDTYVKRFGGTPPYTAGTYGAILHTLAPAIERAGTLDADKVVSVLENSEFDMPRGRLAYMKDKQGRHLHDPKFGSDYYLNIGAQWQGGTLKGVWPNNYKETPKAKPLTFKGTVPYKVPDWIIAAYRN